MSTVPPWYPTARRCASGRRSCSLHGGPGSYDHSYFKPDFARLTTKAQVVYLDLRDHGRSARQDPADWSFETCADDVRAFCDTIGIARPIVYGHSMGGFVAMLYGARHPGHAGALVLQSTYARFDLARMDEGFRRVAGDDVADWRGATTAAIVTDDEWARSSPRSVRRVPDREQLGRRIANRRSGQRDGVATRVRCRRPAGPHRLPDARLRRGTRPRHPGGGRPGDR